MKRTLRIMGAHGTEFAGHGEIDLDADTDLAQKLFEEAIQNGRIAFNKKVDDEGYERATTFDKHAQDIIIISPMAGG